MTKKYFSMVLVTFLLVGLCACKKQVPSDTYDTDTDNLTTGTLYYSKAAGTLTFSAVFHAKPATDGTWHFIVNKQGAMASMSIFTTDVSPHQFYKGLKLLSATDGENVTPTNLGDNGTFTQGSVVDVTITWNGAAKKYTLDELLDEKIPDNSTLQEKLGIEMRFGGNRANEATVAPPSNITGCLMCLYSCAAGVTSNAMADLYIKTNKDDGAFRYFGSDLVPADGTVVTITVKVVK